MARPYTRHTQQFNGRTYSRRCDGYYERYSGTRGLGTERRHLMHREVWEHYYGPIPEGNQIHHRDHDRGNNNIDNLACVTPKEHAAEHPERGWGSWDTERRSEQRREEWAKRQPRLVICHNCGEQFLSTGVRAKYCNAKCRKQHRRERDRELERRRYDPAKRREKYERAKRAADRE